MMPNHLSRDDYSPEETFQAAQNELKAARWLSDFSVAAYLKGNLQPATDARSKAAILCARAAELLATLELDRRTLDRIRSVLNGVRGALAEPIALDFKLWRDAN